MKYNKYKMDKNREKIDDLKKSASNSSFKEYPLPDRVYRHYKGGLYKTHFLAKHTETGEDMVVYTSLIFGSHYCRPLDKWNEPIEGDRFSLRFVKVNTY